MRMIKRLAKQMLCEADRAEKYAKEALEYRSIKPSLADIYYKMGSAALECSDTMHNTAQKIIAESESNGGVPPKFMLDKWKEASDEVVCKAAKIRIYLDMYR